MGLDALLENELGHILATLQKLYIHSLSIPGGRNWAYRYFRSMGSACSQNTGWFSKFLYWSYLGYSPKFQKLHIQITITFYPRVSKSSLFFALRAAVSGMQADFQNCHIWAWNLAIGQSSRSCIYHLYRLSFYTRDWNWAYFTLWTAVSEIRAEFSKLPYLGMNLGKWAKYQKLHIYFLSTSGGWNWTYFRSPGSTFKIFLKLPYLGMKLGHWPKFHKLHIYSLSTTGGQNWAYFRSTGSGLQDTGRFSKLPYLGMKFGHWPKFQKLRQLI